ncbi:MAG: preprotein translocase subunit SecE [Gaiellaceae bacterium]
MARQTRQQRRARRTQSEPALAGGPPVRPPARPTANGGDEPRRRPDAERERSVPGSGPVHFVQESVAELKKVEWPSQHAVVSGTAVVLIACIIVGFYLWLNDELWKYVVQHVLLR